MSIIKSNSVSQIFSHSMFVNIVCLSDLSSFAFMNVVILVTDKIILRYLEKKVFLLAPHVDDISSYPGI